MKTMKTQFKVNDYVRVFGRTTKITWIQNEGSDEVEYYNTAVGNYRDGCLDPSGLEPWKQQEGEWVVCTIGSIKDMFSVFKYNEETYNDIKTMNANDTITIEPFIGELPFSLKELK